MTPKDQKRVEFLKKKHKLKEVLPPNVLKTGYKTFKFTERDGEKATEFGMGAMLPEPVKPKKDKIRVSKGLGNVADENWKKVDPAIFDKCMKDLTLKEVDILKNAGIPLEEFEKAKAAKLEGDKSISGKADVKDVLDDKGKVIGKESTKKSIVYDAGKKTTTTTKTTVKYDGTIETSQQTTFSLAGDKSNNLDIEKQKKKSKNTEKGLDEKLKNKKILKKKDILKKKESDRRSKRNKKR